MDKQEDGRDTDDGPIGREHTFQHTEPDSAGQGESVGGPATYAGPPGEDVRSAFDSFGRRIVGQIPNNPILIDAIRRRDEAQRMFSAVNQEVESLLRVLCPTDGQAVYNLAEGVVVVNDDANIG